MTLTIHPDLIQGSDEWLDQRRGIITASVVGQLISARKLGTGEYPCPDCEAAENDPCRSKRYNSPIKTMHPQRAEYARTHATTVLAPASNDYSNRLTLVLVAERITGWTDPNYISDDMLRGLEDEPRARDKYSEHYATATEVGFITEDRWGFTIGYSPDGLVGDDGLIEVKSRRPKAHLSTIIAGQPPIETMGQLQCGLLVTGREWIDYISYCGGMPMYVKRVYPQQNWFDAILAAAQAFEDTAAEMQRTYSESIIGLHPTERTIEQEIVI